MTQIRKTIEHFDIPGHVRELTFSCHGREPLLARGGCCSLMGAAVSVACAKHSFDLLAFVFMPEHVHLLVFPTQDTSVSPLLSSIKLSVSQKAKRWFVEHDPELVERLTVEDKPGKWCFRFWQAGPGYDRNITSEDTLRTTIRYIHNNPLKRGLCANAADWKWSSWSQFHAPEVELGEDVPRIVRRFV